MAPGGEGSGQQLQLALMDWGRALERLGEALTQDPDNPLLIDAVIQRFEFCFELTWKTLKRALLLVHGFDAVSPRMSLQKAFAVGWLEGESPWLDMLGDRNLTAHTYKEALAGEIFQRIPRYHAAMVKLHGLLSRQGQPWSP